MSQTGESEWAAQLAALLPGPDAGARAAAFEARAPVSYRDLTSPEEAAHDLTVLAEPFEVSGSGEAQPAGAAFGGRHRLVVRPARDDAYTFRIRRFGEGGIELTTFLPVLESFGLVVVEAVPHLIGPGPDGEPAVHIDDIGVRTDAPHGPEALRFVPEIHGPRLVDALEALARGATDVDSLNRLVIMAGFDWRQVMVLRAYLRYWLQCGTSFTWADLSDPLVDFPDVARALIGYFQARFDPETARSSSWNAARRLGGRASSLRRRTRPRSPTRTGPGTAWLPGPDRRDPPNQLFPARRVGPTPPGCGHQA